MLARWARRSPRRFGWNSRSLHDGCASKQAANVELLNLLQEIQDNVSIFLRIGLEQLHVIGFLEDNKVRLGLNPPVNSIGLLRTSPPVCTTGQHQHGNVPRNFSSRLNWGNLV